MTNSTLKGILFLCISLILVTGLQAQDGEVTIVLENRWNMISINVIPPFNMFEEGEGRGPDVVLMLARLRQAADGDHRVEQFQSNSGRFYSPEHNFNGIPFWNLNEGYHIVIVEDVELPLEVVWDGGQIAPDTDIQLVEGWNLISYFPTYELDAGADDSYVISPILEFVQIAIDDRGKFMVPALGFSNMEPWRPGEGYIVRATEDVMFNYPEEREDEPFQPLVGDHWRDGISDALAMQILIQNVDGIEPTPGDQIGAFNLDGDFVGSGTFQENGLCGLTVVGDKYDLREGNDLEEGESFDLIYWSEEHQRESEVVVEAIRGFGGDREEMVFESSDFYALDISVEFPQVIQVSLVAGWNLMSINIVPDADMYLEDEQRGPDHILMWEQLRINEDEHNVLLVKDGWGHSYDPAQQFNNIDFWDLTHGYQVRVSEDAVATWEGVRIPADSDIPLSAGWNMIAYYPEYRLDAGAPDYHALSSIIDHVQVAQDGQGGYMIPEEGFSNMGHWESGRGYQVRVDEDVVLNYPEQQEGDEYFVPYLGDHWGAPAPTDRDILVLVKSFSGVEPELGDQVAAFGIDGNMVGVGSFENDMCGFTVWGTDSVDEVGLQPGEAFEMMYWDESAQSLYEVSVDSFRRGEGLFYSEDGDWIIVDISTGMSVLDPADLPTGYTLSPPYPNPFNAIATLDYSIPTSSQVQLRVFDISGKEIAMLFNGVQAGGPHSVAWDGGSASSGVYLFLLEVNGNSSVTRGVLLR